MKKIQFFICFFLMLISQISSGTETFVLKVGYSPMISHLPLIVSHDHLRLAKTDFKPELIQFSSFTSLEAALRAGAIDISAVPASIAFNIASDEYRCKECAIRIIGSVHRGGSLLVSTIGGMDSFKGEIIAVPGTDSTETMVFRELMASKQYVFGIDYKMIGDSFSSVIKNMASGRIRAAFFPEPYGTLAVHEKIAGPVQYANPMPDETHYTVLVVKKRLIADHPDIVRTWLESVIKACRTIEKDIEECGGRQTAILQSSFFGFPRHIIAESLKNRVGGIRFGGFVPELSELKKLYNDASDLKLIMKSVDWNDLIEPDLMDQAIRE